MAVTPAAWMSSWTGRGMLSVFTLGLWAGLFTNPKTSIVIALNLRPSKSEKVPGTGRILSSGYT